MNTQVIFYDLLNAIYHNDRVAVNEKLLLLLELNKSNESLPTVEKIYRFGGSYQVWGKPASDRSLDSNSSHRDSQ